MTKSPLDGFIKKDGKGKWVIASGDKENLSQKDNYKFIRGILVMTDGGSRLSNISVPAVYHTASYRTFFVTSLSPRCRCSVWERNTEAVKRVDTWKS